MNKPNFIIFVTDDQGYGDLSCMGTTDFRTPNLDTLASCGVRFTNWYSNSPVCSPSRASLLTGRYPIKAGVRSIVAGHRTATGLPPAMPTIATELKTLGYQTFLSGKWHLGMAPGSRPHEKGFDHSFGILAGCVDYFSHIFYYGIHDGNFDPVHDLWEDNKEIWANGKYATEMITEKAVSYLKQACCKDSPFFMYVAYNAPHYPMHAPKKYIDRFPNLPPDRRIMAAMLSAVDDGIGEIIAELKKQGCYKNTCIFFMSDNGPSRESRNWLDGTKDPYYGGSAGNLKGHKFSLFDGGIRVPAILTWPEKIPAGRVIDEPAAAMDIFPAFLSFIGADPTEYDFDGLDITHMVIDKTPAPDRQIFWEQANQTAVRRGPWKLVLNGQIVEDTPPQDSIHLSNLDEDMSEQVNLKDKYPQLTAELTNAANNWRKEMEDFWKQNHQGRYNGITGFNRT
ncbi:MAG: sulfatase-like hydrolase/transferase [Planctomycetota bacterium]